MDILGSIKAIIILNLGGKRALAEYYDDKIDARKFEQQLFLKTRNQKTGNDIFIIDDSLIVHRFISELHINVVGNKKENPLILDRVLGCLVEVITTLMNRNPEQKTLFGNLDQFILALDEICDRGILLETDPSLVLERVCLRDGIAEQSLAQVLQSATEIRFPWIRS